MYLGRRGSQDLPLGLFLRPLPNKKLMFEVPRLISLMTSTLALSQMRLLNNLSAPFVMESHSIQSSVKSARPSAAADACRRRRRNLASLCATVSAGPKIVRRFLSLRLEF